MAGLFPSPLSSDAADKLNHKRMVLLLLLLSLASFIIPLHPLYQSQPRQFTQTGQEPAQANVLEDSQSTQDPTGYDVFCWCPNQFTSAMVRYTNAYCTNGYLSALSGDDRVKSVYYLPMSSPIPLSRDDLSGKSLRNDVVTVAESRKIYFDKIRQQNKMEAEKEKVSSRIKNLVTFQTPLMLLVIAIILALPQAIWSILSECCSSFNAAQTLEASTQAATMDATSRNQFYDDLRSSIGKCVLHSPKSSSGLYLMKKVLAIAVVLGLLLVASQHALPELEDLENQLGDSKKNFNLDDSQNFSASDASIKMNASKSKKDSDSPMSQEKLNGVFLCDFSIRRLQDMHRYTVQCIATIKEPNQQSETSHVAPKRQSDTQGPKLQVGQDSSRRDENLLKLETVLFHLVTAFLWILLVSNVLSLCAWVYRLLSASSRNAVRLSGQCPMDLVWLVHMARINCGPHVAYKLAQSASDFDKINMTELSEAT